MSFEVDRYSPAWAHIALCADLTWTAEPPDDFIIANQLLWSQHCRVSQVLQEATVEAQNLPSNNQCELTDKRATTSQNQENGSCSGRRSVKDVIPESRLAQFYGNFYYDEVREKCYTNPNERTKNGRGYNGQGCENSDLTECWMLPETQAWFDFLPQWYKGYLLGLCHRHLQCCYPHSNVYHHLTAYHLYARGRALEIAPSQSKYRKVEYWFHKLVDETSDRSFPRRRRQYRMLTDDDLIDINGHQSAASERWDSAGARAAGEEATLAARVLSVRPLWTSPPPARSAPRPRAPSPPATQRKIRARRRQPKRLTALAPPPPAYCLEVPAQLFCDPCKFQFDQPRPPQLTECQRAVGRLSASVQAAMRASAARCQPYRGTNVSRYAPTGQRPARCPDRRYGVWWPRDHPSPRLDHRFQLTHLPKETKPAYIPQNAKLIHLPQDTKPTKTDAEETEKVTAEDNTETTTEEQDKPLEKPEKPKAEQIAADGQQPSTSAAAINTSLMKKRLYSTVLSMSAPAPINLSVGCVRLAQKLAAPGILKLNPKLVLASRIRPPVVDTKFEELEKEALEQYKASDESIDTTFRELEKQAVEQYSASNSNTSCSSGNSGEKAVSSSPSIPEEKSKPDRKQPAKFYKDKAVDSVVIYSQNFPDLNTKGQTSSVMNLKNFHTPPRGEKKEQNHRPNKLRSLKIDSQRAASDTDYEAREAKGHKGPMRWTLHVVPPKKRHLTMCVSDFSSDEEMEDASGSIKDAGPRIKNCAGRKAKMSAHGAGDLHPIMRKT